MNLELLEDRLAPAVITWDGGGGDFHWENACNWSSDVLPGAEDIVRIETAGITISHTADETVTIQSLSGAANINWLSGTLEITAGQGFPVSGQFNNSATVEVQGGNLPLWGGGTSSGSFNVWAGAGLQFLGDHTLGNISGQGNVVFHDGTIAVQGCYDISGVGSSTLARQGDIVFTGRVLGVGEALTVYQGSSADFGATPLTVKDLTLGDNVSPGTLSAGDVTVTRRLDWWMGTLTGPGTRATIEAGAQAVIGAGGFDLALVGRVLDNRGTATLMNGGAATTLTLQGGAVINNFNSMQVAASYILGSGTGEAFRNYGDFQRTAFPVHGGTITQFEVPFDNYGSVTVVTGSLNLWGGGTSSGAFSGPAGNSLSFDQNTVLTRSARIEANLLDIFGTLTLQFDGGTSGVLFPQIAGQSVRLWLPVLTISPGPAFRPRLNDRYTILNNTGSAGIGGLGVFAALEEGSIIPLADGTRLQISYRGIAGTDGIGNDVVLTVIFTPVPPGRLQGLVWEDFNNDGQIDFGERAIQGVAITLTGTDDRGNAVNQTVSTDSQGVYEFLNVWPGTYTISEAQPAGFADGRDTLGTVNGQPSGNASVNDRFSGIVLPPGGNGVNYNFGERPLADGSVHQGQTATIGFWQNQNGQALINALNGGAGSTQLGNWLAATFSHMYGADAGVNNLAGKTNGQIADFFTALFELNGPKLDAQVLAVALATYVTDQSLAGTTATAYGFQVSTQGVGYATFNVGSNGAAFGVANNTTMTVLDILLATNARTREDLLYDQDGTGTISALEQSFRAMANTVYTGINGQGDI